MLSPGQSRTTAELAATAWATLFVIAACVACLSWEAEYE